MMSRAQMVMSILHVVLFSFTLATRDEHKFLKKLSFKALQRVMNPMYDALPKNEFGNIDSRTARYAAHRSLMHLHGWLVFGLAPEPGNVTTTPSPSADLEGSLRPAQIERLLQKHLEKKQGLTLDDAIEFTFDIERAVHTVAVNELQWAWRTQGLSSNFSDSIELDTVYEVLDLVMIAFSLKEFKDDPRQRQKVPKTDPYWTPTQSFVRSVARSVLRSGQRTYDFTNVKRVVMEVVERHGTWQNGQCLQIKEQLIGKERSCPGRVELAHFYKEFYETGARPLVESPPYLESLGTLEGARAEFPSVLIPNYIQSSANFVYHTKLYAVVCPDECEDILGRIEQQVQGPDATPDVLVDVIRSLSSTSAPDGPGSLPYWSLDRLNKIARLHNGRVPLHGRLFAQWLHGVYPRECPFPQLAGTADQMMPQRFEANTGFPRVATKQMMQAVIELARERDEAAPDMARTVSDSIENGDCFPWIPHEDLIAPVLPPKSLWKEYRGVAGFAGLAVVLVSLFATLIARGCCRRLRRKGSSVDMASTAGVPLSVDASTEQQ
eukprot:TRINITY_DN47857_c0_g1_i1.p1 TRINITY_DN47857_c0_g1~~TRINITY_DN47857_c0_g1_i1.p1  ORF type:complete len:569 (-),score=93.19 TRINITY_DN47857_c0_g1_i1:137-1786(-)